MERPPARSSEQRRADVLPRLEDDVDLWGASAGAVFAAGTLGWIVLAVVLGASGGRARRLLAPPAPEPGVPVAGDRRRSSWAWS